MLINHAFNTGTIYIVIAKVEGLGSNSMYNINGLYTVCLFNFLFTEFQIRLFKYLFDA